MQRGLDALVAVATRDAYLLTKDRNEFWMRQIKLRFQAKFFKFHFDLLQNVYLFAFTRE